MFQWFTVSHWKALLGQPGVTPRHVGTSAELMSLRGFSRALPSTANESHSVSRNEGKKNLWRLLF